MKILIIMLITFLAVGGTLSAQQTAGAPNAISYQGMITTSDGNPLIDGEYPITVTLYGDEKGTVEVWRDTYMTTVHGGVFNIYLGSGKTALPAPGQMDRPLWIGTRVDGGEEMRPLTRLGSSPYAVNVPDNAITTSKLADGAVTADKVDLDYISGVSINGKKIDIDGGVLNIQAGKDIEVDYDEMTKSLVIGAPAGVGARREKEEHDHTILGSAVDAWGMRGDGLTPTNHLPVVSNDNDWLGTIGNAKFTIKVNSQRVMLYQPNGILTPNIIGGYSGNSAAATSDGSIIAGGGTPGFVNTIGGQFNVISGGVGHTFVNGGTVGGVIGGGHKNTIGSATALAHYSAIGGGFENTITGGIATIAGGRANSTTVDYGATGGGIGNIITGWIGTIAGGDGNEIHAIKSAIGGGYRNKITANASYSTIAGGYTNAINNTLGSIGGGQSNLIDGQNSTIGGGVLNAIVTNGNYATIGGGRSNRVQSTATTIAGGDANIISADYSAIGGGQKNAIDAIYSVVGGGRDNLIISSTSAITGGSNNAIRASLGAIGGGNKNQIITNGVAASIPGGENLIAQSYGQTVIGVSNIASGTRTPGSALTDEPIFIVGNGIAGPPSNAFEVSYNGHSTVYHNTGGATPVIHGATYTDNIVYAWGSYDAANNQGCYFGVANSKITYMQKGWYQVTMDIVDPDGNPVILSCASVTATVATPNGPGSGPKGLNATCAFIKSSQVVNNVFDIYILDQNCNLVDEFFSFKVTGRP